MHLAEIVRRQAAARPGDPSYSCAETDLTWRQTDERTSRLAAALYARGLRPGDRVAVLARACHRYWEVHFGCAKAGLVVVPVNHRLQAAEVKHILSDVGAKAVVVDARLADVVAGAGIPLRLGFGLSHGQPLDYEQTLAEHEPVPPAVELDDGDLNVVAYTSGTTGTAKGAMLSHRGSVLSAYGYGMANRFRSDDVVLTCMPPYVLRGQSAGLSPALAGAHVVMADFVASEVVDIIERRRITQLQLAPAMITLLLAEPDLAGRDLSSIRAIWTGGAPIRPAELERFGAVFGDVLGSTFGMTEATGVAGMRYRLSGDPADLGRLASIGRPLPLLDVEVRRPDGFVTDDDEVGEIVVHGDTVMTGYWNAPEATAAVLRDGWYHTGDMARRDRDGYLYLVDRRVDVIVSGGINVYSLEVEQVINRMPGVAESAVVGIPDELWGEAVAAFVVCQPGATISESAVIAGCRAELAHFKAPRSVHFPAELPRNAMGKLDKRALRAPYWSGRGRSIAGLSALRPLRHGRCWMTCWSGAARGCGHQANEVREVRQLIQATRQRENLLGLVRVAQSHQIRPELGFDLLGCRRVRRMPPETALHSRELPPVAQPYLDARAEHGEPVRKRGRVHLDTVGHSQDVRVAPQRRITVVLGAVLPLGE
jgi:acyl-CoA synthetase (AMP-forming)/AMP-acid ligase II